MSELLEDALAWSAYIRTYAELRQRVAGSMWDAFREGFAAGQAAKREEGEQHGRA